MPVPKWPHTVFASNRTGRVVWVPVERDHGYHSLEIVDNDAGQHTRFPSRFKMNGSFGDC